MAEKKAVVITFKQLLGLAHQKGLESVLTEPVNVTPDFAFFKATVTLRDGGTFMGHGDASPKNVRQDMAIHLIRLAETRAIVRALRLAVNIGEVSIEELADYDGHQSAQRGRESATPAGKVLNDSGAPCPHCHAPSGKLHATACEISKQAAPVAL